MLNDQKVPLETDLGRVLVSPLRCTASPVDILSTHLYSSCTHLPFQKRSYSLAFIEVFLRIIAGVYSIQCVRYVASLSKMFIL